MPGSERTLDERAALRWEYVKDSRARYGDHDPEDTFVGGAEDDRFKHSLQKGLRSDRWFGECTRR